MGVSLVLLSYGASSPHLHMLVKVSINILFSLRLVFYCAVSLLFA